MSNRTLIPTTTSIAAACDALDKVIELFLEARSSLTPTQYEADVEAVNLFNLTIRHVEGVIALARNDLMLISPAYASARAAFETAIKAAWMVDAIDHFDREARWLVHLAEEERMHRRMANLETDKVGGERSMDLANTFASFRAGVTKQMPAHVKLLAGNPNLKEMCGSIGGSHFYALYIYLSQFVHGGHHATKKYRQNIGTMKVLGDFTAPTDWYLALRLCWLSLSHPGNIVLSRVSNSTKQFLSPEQEAMVVAAIEVTKDTSLSPFH